MDSLNVALFWRRIGSHPSVLEPWYKCSQVRTWTSGIQKEKVLSSNQFPGKRSDAAPPAKDWKQYLQQPRLAAGAVEETFKILKTALSEDIVKATQAVYLFELSGEDGGTWYLDLKNNGGYAGSGQPSDQVDVVMTMTTSDFVKMFSGKLKPTMAFMSGKLKIKGNMALAIKLERLMTQMNSRL
uniref:SCP2 domain-containing protein n=1 Tax=Monodelphis domestica TaxID=13616 RepID=A0A5F8GDI1_MONDO